MKRLLLTFSILVSITQIQAQVVFNRAYHDVSEVTNSFLVNINGDIYYTTHGRDAFNFGNCFLYKYDATGVLKFRSPVLGFNVADKAFTSLDNNLIVVGHNSLCDVLMPSTNFITKIDVNGNVLFNAIYSTSTSSQSFGLNDKPKAALQYSDSSYFTFTDSLLYKHSKTGQLISKTNLGISEISSALELMNGSLLLSAKQNSLNALVVLSASGVLTYTVTFPVLLNKIIFYGSNSKLMGLGTDGKIYKISPNYGLIGSSTFPNSAFVNDFVCQADTIYSIFSTSSDLSNYRMCDTSFTDISLSSTTTHSFNQNAICYANNKVNILATGIAGKNSLNGADLTYASLSQLYKNSTNNFQHDLSLLSIEADSLYSTSYTFTLSSSNYTIATAYLRPKIIVKNNSNGVINSFKLNTFTYLSECGYAFFQEQFSNLNLSPGNTLSLVSSGFVPKELNMVAFGSTVALNYCFYISLPNGETDKIVEDNEACKTFNFLVTSLKENSKLEKFISIAPNPFNDNFTIRSEETMSGYALFNSLGEKVKEEDIFAKEYTIQTEDLVAGIYFIRIKSENGLLVKKMIKN